MPNHPNRGPVPTAASNPKPAEIRAIRDQYGLTPQEAAALVFSSGAQWSRWEKGEQRMHPAIYFCLATRALQVYGERRIMS